MYAHKDVAHAHSIHYSTLATIQSIGFTAKEMCKTQPKKPRIMAMIAILCSNYSAMNYLKYIFFSVNILLFQCKA